MQVQIVGKHIDVGAALQEHATNRLVEGVAKYSQRPVDAQVTFSKDRHEYMCDIVVHLSSGMRAKSRGKADEIYAACENGVDRMETQLRRYKRRLKNHHSDRADPIEAFAEASYVLEAREEDDSAVGTDDLQPVIIAEMPTQVQTLSVGEAVMQMELLGEAMLVFRNVSHGGVNVVHRREDGNVGWVDPRRVQ